MQATNMISQTLGPIAGLNRTNSQAAWEKANLYSPGKPGNHKGLGYNSPIYIKNARGATITDLDKNEYIDFYFSQGANILGHAPAKVLDAIKDTLAEGTNYEMPTPADALLAELIVEAIPSVEQVTLMNSGTEAVISAIRLARAFTGKDKIIKFDGSFHGRPDQFQAITGSGLESISAASAKGIPREFAQHTISVPFNNQEAVSDAFEKYPNDIAAIIMEPVPAGIGVVLPQQGFLKFLREIARNNQSLLIFDEITTGFRPKISGAQGYFGIRPDLTILGKIIGGGLPLAAMGGSKDIMSLAATESFAHTINPLATTAGLATLKRLNTLLFYETLNHKSRDFIYWLKEITENKGIVIQSFHSMFSVYFSETEVINQADVQNSDVKRFEKLHKRALEKGVFLSPSPYGANFVSMAHLPEELNTALEVVHQILKTV